MSAGELPNQIAFRGIQDVLNAQLTNVQENVEQLSDLKDSLYVTVTPLMSLFWKNMKAVDENSWRSQILPKIEFCCIFE